MERFSNFTHACIQLCTLCDEKGFVRLYSPVLSPPPALCIYFYRTHSFSISLNMNIFSVFFPSHISVEKQNQQMFQCHIFQPYLINRSNILYTISRQWILDAFCKDVLFLLTKRDYSHIFKHVSTAFN